MEDDGALVADALAGGPEAFTSIVAKYQSVVFGVALARLRNFHDAEDIAQSVFVDAFTQLSRLQETKKLGPWLRTLAINKSIDRQRSRKSTVDIDLIANDPAHAETPVALTSEGLRDQMLDAIGRLGEAQRETVTLFYLTGHSIQEVAAIQDTPVGTIKARLHHARRKLKQDVTDMVESTLKTEAPGEDLAQRVFETLSQHDRHGYDLFQDLRRLGAGENMQSFEQASQADSAETRRMATNFAAQLATKENDAQAIGLVERGLKDPNRFVRAGAVRAGLRHLPCTDDIRHQRFVPLVVDMLFDRSKEVRWIAADYLQEFPDLVSIDRAAQALLDETNRVVRRYKEQLLRTILKHRRGEDTPGPFSLDETLSIWKRAIRSATSSERVRALKKMPIPLNDSAKITEVVRLAAATLADPMRRVRRRAAYELRRWAAEVPQGAVEAALEKETDDRARRSLTELLERVKEQQSS
ncbi:MAG: sigma-70 family RNA polymerase sigma factor [Gemmatimonadetes bacterium]|jgi:RNA polymerase sigma-70 factor (ECF subfamily)|nr:sigma-70 family RNA polymerase sigma factor [Gemmatimonadota bacterium]MBT5057752.1 sigma-70 family RNA polymerase sigma factor [Gemmatimonadota bacterium]MBT5141336.1 sigma-70 family RNA polymerase sigma factor [Gemmatimonadota bacterium]MBT5590417.1 sigma-70 family RNA polymerase sigma factor [Gemmatimonadota bacterium]MBT5964254.1 sigma-70 family RNA polymerase sigma factor [Gemmatimonadota bacterium]